jgi:branched-chain amino acid transport system substrate-binding protein
MMSLMSKCCSGSSSGMISAFAADAFKRAGAADPKALVDAIRTTNITDNISIGPGIQFNEKGQNDKLKNAAIQNRAGKFATIAPKAQSGAKPECQ